MFGNQGIGHATFGKTETQMLFWHSQQIDTTLIYEETMLELAQSISKNVGTMRKLPRWILDGVVVGIVNG